VRVATRDGASGIGFSYAGYEAGELAISAIELLVGPTLLGCAASNPADCWQAAYQRSLLHGRAGIVQRVLSALDIALWDRNARAAAKSLAEQIGLVRNFRPPAYIGGGYYAAGGDNAEADALLQDVATTAVAAVKVKIGRYDSARETIRLSIFRSALGDAVEIAADANGAFGGVGQAKAAARAFEKVRIAMLEDPFGPDELSSYRKLSADLELPISTGELFTNEHEFDLYAEHHAADIFQIDATACGGITAFLRIARRAAAQGIPLETHWFPELHRQLALTTEQVQRVEVFAGDQIINFARLVVNDPQATGMGLALNPAEIDRTTVARASLSVR
jgi:L-alanine-DL-glutamate epimerase-like enolase superfamily enzyme